MPAPYSKEKRDKAVSMYLAGASMWDIFVATGATKHPVRLWVRAAGHELRPPHGPQQYNMEEIESAMESTGGNIAAAARQIGCYPGTIRNRLWGKSR